jgi:quercetin dioxygenase-like cupin family protein
MHDHAAQHRPADLTALTTELLVEAGGTTSRRASRTVISGSAQRVTLTAMSAGAELAEHTSPSPASLQVLRGEVELRLGTRTMPVRAGELVAVPPQRHSLVAATDAAILLTVAVD